MATKQAMSSSSSSGDGDKEVVDKTYRVARDRGYLGDRATFEQGMYALNAESATITWQMRCNPIERWIRQHPQLVWFIDPARVAREGAETAKQLKQQTPDLSQEQFLEKLYEIWYHQLLEFAKSFGY